VQVVIPTDAGDETWRVLRLFDLAARRANFSLTSWVGQIPTEKALAAMRSGFDSLPWQPVQ
jgi:hypothetical protein